jgi:hypothetical protein
LGVTNPHGFDAIFLGRVTFQQGNVSPSLGNVTKLLGIVTRL